MGSYSAAAFRFIVLFYIGRVIPYPYWYLYCAVVWVVFILSIVEPETTVKHNYTKDIEKVVRNILSPHPE